jgi:flagellar motor protein MotB
MTFSDVITLLMTFFILLLTFATNQPETFDRIQVAMFGGGGANGFASDADGMERDALLLRERARSGRMSDDGAEIPPIYSDPSLVSLSKSVAGLEQDEMRVLSTSYHVEQTLESLVSSPGTLTSLGQHQMRMIATQLRKQPVQIDLIAHDEESLSRAQDLADFLSQEERVPEAKIGVGIAPQHAAEGRLLMVIARQGANRAAQD